jgi:hypothetical protein
MAEARQNRFKALEPITLQMDLRAFSISNQENAFYFSGHEMIHDHILLSNSLTFSVIHYATKFICIQSRNPPRDAIVL